MRNYLDRRPINTVLIAIALSLAVSSCALTEADIDFPATTEVDQSIDRTAPAWFVDNVKFLTGGSGRWLASNAQYQTEQELWDSYGIEWQAGPDHASMTGRLFGIKDQTESSADFWQFAQFWNPETRQGVIQQFGWGQIGLGHLETDGQGGATKMTQRFIDQAGNVRNEGHRSTNPGADEHVTTSFQIIDGRWQKQRSYTWIRQPTPADKD